MSFPTPDQYLDLYRFWQHTLSARARAEAEVELAAIAARLARFGDAMASERVRVEARRRYGDTPAVCAARRALMLADAERSAAA